MKELMRFSIQLVPNGAGMCRDRDGDWVEFDDYDSLRAELLATRRELARARAKALRRMCAYVARVTCDEHSSWPACLRRRNKHRAMRLLTHYARKFEREAEEMGR